MAWGVRNISGVKWVNNKTNNNSSRENVFVKSEDSLEKRLSSSLFKKLSLINYSPDQKLINEILNT